MINNFLQGRIAARAPGRDLSINWYTLANPETGAREVLGEIRS
jgi:hypothetical protein